MPRTKGQEAADEALRAAIEETLRAYNLVDMGSPAVLTEYIVITCHRGFEENGQGSAQYNWTCQDDGMPWHHVLGLMDEAKRQMLRDQEDHLRRSEGQ